MLKLEPVGKVEELAPNKAVTEEEVQYYLANKIVKHGLKAALEYQAPYCRFDILVFGENNKAIAIIEVKRSKYLFVRHKHKNVYTSFGLPVYIIEGKDDAKHFVETVLPYLQADFDNNYANIQIVGSRAFDSYHKYRETKKRYRKKRYYDPDLNIKYDATY